MDNACAAASFSTHPSTGWLAAGKANVSSRMAAQWTQFSRGPEMSEMKTTRGVGMKDYLMARPIPARIAGLAVLRGAADLGVS
jgi:hypothetical protein